MSAKLHEQFMKFHDTIKLDKETSQLKEKREVLQNDIESKLPSKLEDIGIDITKSDLHFFDQGSYRQNVSTGIVSDAPDRDVAVDFELDIDTHNDPRKIKKCVRDALKIKDVRDPLIKDPCVTVKYMRAGEEKIHIDFPIYAKHNGNFYLARGKEFSTSPEWEECDPHGLNDYMDTLFAGNEGNQLRRIVRYLKKWKLEKYGDSYTKDQIPPSIALTLMAGKYFSYTTASDGQEDDLTALKNVVDGIKGEFTYNWASEKYNISYDLPVKPWSNVFFKMTENYQDVFHQKWVKLCNEVQNAIDASEDYEAAKFLQKVFGQDFELPEKPQAKTGAARNEYSYA